MIELTPQQSAALHADPGKVVFAVDPATSAEFAILSARQFEKVREIFDASEEFDAREMYPLMLEAWRDVIDDPAMDVYNEYLPRNKEAK